MTGSALLAAAVPAVLWAISYPLSTALFAVAVAVGVRTVRVRVADRSAADRPTVDAADPADGA